MKKYKVILTESEMRKLNEYSAEDDQGSDDDEDSTKFTVKLRAIVDRLLEAQYDIAYSQGVMSATDGVREDPKNEKALASAQKEFDDYIEDIENNGIKC